MQTRLRVGDATIEIDEHGFVQELDRWNDEVAAVLATREGIPSLGPEHWKVVRYLRQHYIDHRVAPMIRKLCKETGLTLKRIYELFPAGPANGACKVAGLPNGKGCV